VRATAARGEKGEKRSQSRSIPQHREKEGKQVCILLDSERGEKVSVVLRTREECADTRSGM